MSIMPAHFHNIGTSSFCIQHAIDSICSTVELLLDALGMRRCSGNHGPCVDKTHVTAGQQPSFTETTHLQLHAVTTVLRHDSTHSKLVQKHHARLLQHLNEVYTHLGDMNPPSVDTQSAMGDLVQLIQQLQNVHV